MKFRFYATWTPVVAVLLAIAQIHLVNATAPGNLTSPFDLGTQLNICQGYENNGGTHSGSSSISLDITGSQCDSSLSSKAVRAPAQGIVVWYVQSSGSLCISTTAGVSVMLTHINSGSTPGTAVARGQVVGTVATPGDRQNNGVSHLHMQAWSSSNCSGSQSQVAFDALGGARICGSPDMAPGGPNPFNTGAWGGTSFIAQDCNQDIPTSAAGVQRFYSPVVRKHLFTADPNETNILKARSKGTWNYESIAYWVKSPGSCSVNESVYRFYSEQLQVHLYTTDENEKSVLSGYPPQVWRYEGVAYCADHVQTTRTTPVHRFYSEQLKVHLFTADDNERNELSKASPDTWRYEGIAYYAYPD